jgi:hypothetical protein
MAASNAGCDSGDDPVMSSLGVFAVTQPRTVVSQFWGVSAPARYLLSSSDDVTMVKQQFCADLQPTMCNDLTILVLRIVRSLKSEPIATAYVMNWVVVNHPLSGSRLRGFPVTD